MFRPGQCGLGQANGVDEGAFLVVDEECRVASMAEDDDVADPVLDEEPNVDLEPVDPEREDEPKVDPDASATGERQGFAAGQRGDGAG